jgi:hypothetical protein
MRTPHFTSALLLLVVLLCGRAFAQTNTEMEPGTTTISFARGAWDTAKWKPVRMANQTEPRVFVQFDKAIGTTLKSFGDTDYQHESDNAIMLYDLETAEAEIEMTFSIGKGFRGFSAPGLCISPKIKDGVLLSSIAVFVADYTMAVWFQDTAPDGKTVRYRQLFQLGRWSDPAKQHVLRCRISKKESSMAFKVDDSDSVVFTFIGNKNLSLLVDQEVNSLIGVWGCHGECTFHEMKILRPGTLPFLVRMPADGPK